MTTESYPLPAHAANVWLQGDVLFLGLPPSKPGGRAHTVHFPAGQTKAQITSMVEAQKFLKRLQGHAVKRRQFAQSAAERQECQETIDGADWHLASLSTALRQAHSLDQLVSVLRSRAQAAAAPRIGEPGAPVNAQILSGYQAKLEELNEAKAQRQRMRQLRQDPDAFLDFLLADSEPISRQGS